MMKLKSIAILMLLLLIPNPSLSGEITDTEWNILNYLVVTYYSSSARKVECTAYNLNGAPIGGGRGYTQGGVSRISIDTPDKYVGKKLDVSCKDLR